MNELLSESFRLINLPFTLLLILVVVYWLLVAVGALAGPSADADFEVGSHAHIDHDVDLDTMHHNVEGHHSGHGSHETASWWTGALKFLNLGEVPAMVVFSVLILSMWVFNVLANAYWTGGSALLMGIALGVNLVVSAVVTRYVTLPFKPLFRMLSRDHDEKVTIIGQPCRILTSEATPTFGQAEVNTSGAPILINVRTLGDAIIPKGQLAVVVREDADNRIFFIAPNPLPNTQ